MLSGHGWPSNEKIVNFTLAFVSLWRFSGFHIYRKFLVNLSASLDESALLDGCNYFQLFTKIIFPLPAPATATVAIIFFQKYILAGVAAGAVKE